jgi:hypothetical protein
MTVDPNNGNLYYCDIRPKVFSIFALPAEYQGSYGALGGFDTWYLANMSSKFYNAPGGTLALVEISDQLQGMVFCYHAEKTGCKNGLKFLSFPASYCDQFASGCQPTGVTIDANWNVFWTDPVNQVFTECFYPDYTTCSTLINSSQFGTSRPYGLALLNGTAPYMTPGWQFYITDSSCAGDVYTTTAANWNLTLLSSVGNSLSGIGSSTEGTPHHYQHVFVGDTGSCSSGNSSPSIRDLMSASDIVPMANGTTTIFLSSCVGQCLGYFEGHNGSGIVKSGKDMFASTGSSVLSIE